MLLLCERLRLSREIIDVMMRLHLHEPQTQWISVLDQRLLCSRVAASPLRCTGAFYMELGQSQGHKDHCGLKIYIHFFSRDIKAKVWPPWLPWNSHPGCHDWFVSVMIMPALPSVLSLLCQLGLQFLIFLLQKVWFAHMYNFCMLLCDALWFSLNPN